VVGFSFKEEDISKPFRHVVAPARTIYEDRFSPTTGKKLKPKAKKIPEKVEYRYPCKIQALRVKVEHKGETWYKDEEDAFGDEPGSLADTFAKALGCSAAYYGSFPTGEMYIAFYLPVKTSDTVLDDYKCSIGGNLDFNDACRKQSEILKLQQGLKDLGLEPGDPEIISCWTAG
jgi:hypothetical protein